MLSGRKQQPLQSPMKPIISWQRNNEAAQARRVCSRSVKALAPTALAIGGYLDYCRDNGVSVAVESGRGYAAD